MRDKPEFEPSPIGAPDSDTIDALKAARFGLIDLASWVEVNCRHVDGRPVKFRTPLSLVARLERVLTLAEKEVASV